MAASWLICAVRVDNLPAQRLAEIVWPGPMVAGQNGRRIAENVADLLDSCSSGVRAGNVYTTVLADDGTKSTGNIACVQANATGDTITFTYGTKAVVLTEGATGESGFARGASNTTCAANLAACINAHSVLGPLITALGAVGNCGLTAKVADSILHGIAMTTSDGTAFSFTQLTGGTEGTAQYFIQQAKLQRTPT
jgi:hypothetical protein